MISNPLFVKLRDILAQLYPDESSARRIAMDADLSLTRITFGGSALNYWHAILTEAINTDLVDNMLLVCMKEYGRNPTLREVYNQYLNETIPQHNAIQDTTAVHDSPAIAHSSTQTQLPEVPAELKQALENGEVCVFIGAGLSLGAGLPDWYSLIAELAQRINYSLPPRQWATSDTMIDAAQAYVNERGLNSLVMLLKERLDSFGKMPTAAHYALAKLPISLVFTANYDDLLERSFREAGRRVEVVIKDTNIPFMRRKQNVVNIVKLYGDLDQPDTLVLARQQYESFFLQRPQMVSLLEAELARSHMLYLGWSHSDPHYNLIFGELINRFSSFMRMGYAAMFDVPDTKLQELKRKQIQVINIPPGSDRTTQLANWLGSLRSAS